MRNKALKIELEKHLIEVFGGYETEVVFNKIMDTKRRFRADYYIAKHKLIIEVNGGQFSGGRHNRGGKGYEGDLTKMNIANINGFTYLNYTYQMLIRLEYIQDLKHLLII